MKRYKTIKSVWSDLEKGVTIYWSHEGYKVYIEPQNQGCEYQANHFTNKNKKVLSIRCIENYFGGLITEPEIKSLFSKGPKS